MNKRKVLIIMRYPPVKPKRETVLEEIKLESGTVEDILNNEKVKRYNVSPSELKIRVRSYDDYYSETYYTYVEFHRPEDNDEFEKRMKQYEKALKNYNKWYQENEELIKQELERRKVEEDKKENKKKKITLENLEKEKRRIEKQIDLIKKIETIKSSESHV